METKASTSTTAQKAGCGACVLGFVLPLAAAYSHIAAFPISFILGVGGWEPGEGSSMEAYMEAYIEPEYAQLPWILTLLFGLAAGRTLIVMLSTFHPKPSPNPDFRRIPTPGMDPEEFQQSLQGMPEKILLPYHSIKFIEQKPLITPILWSLVLGQLGPFAVWGLSRFLPDGLLGDPMSPIRISISVLSLLPFLGVWLHGLRQAAVDLAKEHRLLVDRQNKTISMVEISTLSPPAMPPTVPWESLKAVVLTQYLDRRGTCRNSKLLLDRGAEEPFFLFNWLEEAPMPKTAELLAEYLSLPLKIDRRSENELDNAHDANDRGDRSRRE